MTTGQDGLPRKLGLIDSTSIVIGTMVGAGIFIVPGSIAREVPSPAAILATWAACGIISFFGALAYAELGAMMPNSGGQYIYLREAYGELTAFLCGWAAFLIVQSGSIAAVSVGFGIYASYLLPQVPSYLWAPAAIAAFSFINYRGVKAGARTQNVFTSLKVAGLLMLIASAFLHRPSALAGWGFARGSLSLDGIVVAMLGSFMAYDGWQYVSFVAGEVREPQRNLPLSLALGTAAVVLLYLLANLAYMHVLPLGTIAATERVAAVAAAETMGPAGAIVIALTIMLSSAGAANGAILTSPRLYFAQARDGLFFRQLGEIHPRFRTPYLSILVQSVWAIVLALSGSYETLLSYVLFAMWLFHALTVFAVIVLRRRDPDRTRPYRIFAYPFTPLLFTVFAFAFVVNTFATRPHSSLVGALLIAAGIPMFWIWKRSRLRLTEQGW